MKGCSLDGIVPKDLEGAHAGNVPVFMENSLQRKDSWSLHDFLVKDFISYPPGLIVSPRAQFHPRAHFLIYSCHIIGLWKIFSAPMLWTNSRPIFFFSTRHLSNSLENHQHTHDIVWIPLKIYFDLGNFSRN